jgi:hypothetical protein
LGGSDYITSYQEKKKKKNNNANDILRLGIWQVALFFSVAHDVHFMLWVICECHEEGEGKWREEVQESEGRGSNMDALYMYLTVPTGEMQ